MSNYCWCQFPDLVTVSLKSLHNKSVRNTSEYNPKAASFLTL